MITKITSRVIGMENPDKAREDLEKILSQREYQVYYEDQRNIVQIWWAQAKQWFRELLSELFSGLNPSSDFADTLLVIMIGIVVLLALSVGYLVVRSMIRKRSFQAHQPFQSADEMEWSMAEHLKAAEKQENMGNYSLATRHQFLAVLLYFHERKWLKAHVWKTNWDYFAELQQKDKHRAEAFYELARIFDEAFYGKRTIEHQEYLDYRKKVQTWLYDPGEKDIQEV